jgi:uncharacterized protein (DUF111 family)
MTVNKDVKQFTRSPSHLLKRAAQYSSHIYMGEVGKSGLTHRQFTVLLAVDNNDGKSQTDLVKVTGIDRSTLADLVARLLQGVPLAAHAAEGEMTTPTGATLLVTLAERFGPLPAGRLVGVGVGLGAREFAGLPNVLRAFLVEEEERQAGRPMVILETTVDDITGEALGALLERVREAGALDAWCLPGTGRKGRPVVELRAVLEPSQVAAVTAAVFEEGATLGVRLVECTRPELARHTVEVSTPFGTVPVKVGVFAGRVVSAKPEHDAVLAAARRSGASAAAVADAARAAAPRLGTAWEG